MATGTVTITPDDKAISEYHKRLQQARKGKDTQHEGNIRHAFANLLEETAKRKKWQLVQEHSDRVEGHTIRYDGVLRDSYNLPHGHWEAKDSSDNLDTEIRKKRERRYSFQNIIFEDTQEAVLFQKGLEVTRVKVDEPEAVADLLTRFYNHEVPPFTEFEQAIEHFQQEIAHIAQSLNDKIKSARKDNKAFKTAYADFMELCRTALNPNIREEAVDEMLIQHMLTERLIRKVFDKENFVRHNVIAGEIEKVIDVLTRNYFNRAEFLGALDRYYKVIERAADELATFKDKQHFINTVYERFFQGYSVKVADTHGIVYTPQEIVDFMCAAVEEVLMDEFGLRLGDKGVNILDPATGTGNFIVNLLQRVDTRDIDRFYRENLFANEVMLLPYYVASLNIEHAYYERTGKYLPFEGISFVDTLDLAERQQMAFSFMTEANTERVERQKNADINVIIGNPPYNVGQVNENDNNRNRKYSEVDDKISRTYIKDSNATLRTQLYDPYVRFFRWATDRLKKENGIVCFVSNNSFIDQRAFDGMRKHLSEDFQRIYVLDLKGDIRKDSMRDGIPLGEKHTVFGLAAMVGISITVLVKNEKHDNHKLYYHAVDWRSTRKEKFLLIEEAKSLIGIKWEELNPDKNNNWLISEHSSEFDEFVTIGSKEAKRARSQNAQAIFRSYSNGVKTNSDAYTFNFSRDNLINQAQLMLQDYKQQLGRWIADGKPRKLEGFLQIDENKLKWIRNTKRSLLRGESVSLDESKIRTSVYRPFTKKFYYFEKVFNEDLYRIPRIFPTNQSEIENKIICTVTEAQVPFSAQITNHVPCLHYNGRQIQCFPFYIYDEDGGNRRENITDWALGQFRAHYGDESIDKWAIFYYVYGVLHHPVYRERYADNLKRELPRIPFVGDETSGDKSAFHAISQAGKALANLHLTYEDAEPYRLKWETTEGTPVSYRVERMKFKGKSEPEDKNYKTYDTLVVNDTLTLTGIPPEVFDYRLGNRSALEWVVDQYRVKTDKRSGITSDPNQYSDNERYIVDLVEKVVTVSLQTVKLVDQIAGYAIVDTHE